MTRLYGNLIALAAGLLVGVVLYLAGSHVLRARAVAHRGAAATAVATHEGRAQVERATVVASLPGVARADSALTRQLETPRPPRAPAGMTVAPAAATPAIPAGDYVLRADYDALGARLDSTQGAAQAYRDSVRVLLVRYPRLVAELDSVTRFQRAELAAPPPRRRCGPSIAAGYGFALVGGVVRSGPSLNVGLGCTL